MPFQLFVAVRMGRDKGKVKCKGFTTNGLGYIFYDSFPLILVKPIGHVMQTIGIVRDRSVAITQVLQVITIGFEGVLITFQGAAKR